MHGQIFVHSCSLLNKTGQFLAKHHTKSSWARKRGLKQEFTQYLSVPDAFWIYHRHSNSKLCNDHPLLCELIWGKKERVFPQPPKRYVLLPQIQLTFKSARSWRDTPTAFRGALYLPPYINCALMMYLFPTHLHKIQMLYSATFCPFKRMWPETSKKKNSFLSPTEEQRLIVALSLAIANSHKCSSLKRSKQLISRFFFRICEMNRVLIISRFYRHQEDQCSQCSS